MKFLNIVASFTFLFTAACVDATSTDEQPLTPEVPTTAEACEAIGARVEGDPGDGSAACRKGERDLGAIEYGIEGGRCCLAKVTTAEACVIIGARVEGDPGDGSASCRRGETDLGRIHYGIEGGRCCS